MGPGSKKPRRSVRPIVGVAIATVVAFAMSWILIDHGRTASDLRASVANRGSVYQFGKIVGWASGATVSTSDVSMMEFEEISNASKFVHGDEFEYGGYVLRVSQIRQVRYAGTPMAPIPETTFEKVVAKIQRTR